MEQISQRVVFLSFQGRSKFRNVCRIFGRKMAFFEGCPVGGRRGWMAVPKKGEGWGLVGCSKEGQVQGRVGLLGSSTGGGKGSGGNPRASVPEG